MRPTRHHTIKRCSQLYRLGTQRLNIAKKPKGVLVEAVNKFIFSDSQLKFSKKPNIVSIKIKNNRA